MFQVLMLVSLISPSVSSSDARAWVVQASIDDIVSWINNKADTIAQGQVVERTNDTIRVRRQVNRKLVDIRLRQKLTRYTNDVVKFQVNLDRVFAGPISDYRLLATLRPNGQGTTRIDVSVTVGTSMRAGQVKISESITEALNNFQNSLSQRFGR